VVLLKGTRRALSLKTDCNGRYVYLNPRRGAMIAVAESARNVVCTGAEPVAITNCLNFGNPYKPEIYWQFAEAVAGLGEACRALGTPVTGGNVSFYNESPSGPVYPTPVVGMLGLVEDLTHVTASAFRDEGDLILLLGSGSGEIGGSEYLALVHGTVAGEPPSLDLTRERAVQSACLRAIRRGLVKSAHDCSDGGLAVAVAECCMVDGPEFRGAALDPGAVEIRPDWYLFGEDQSRILVTADPAKSHEVLRTAREHGVPAAVIGRVGGDRLKIGSWIDLGVREMADVYYGSLDRHLSVVDQFT
jgi:phosphoribosylformylglycinamidine synthase